MFFTKVAVKHCIYAQVCQITVLDKTSITITFEQLISKKNILKLQNQEKKFGVHYLNEFINCNHIDKSPKKVFKLKCPPTIVSLLDCCTIFGLNCNKKLVRKNQRVPKICIIKFLHIAQNIFNT